MFCWSNRSFYHIVQLNGNIMFHNTLREASDQVGNTAYELLLATVICGVLYICIKVARRIQAKRQDEINDRKEQVQ